MVGKDMSNIVPYHFKVDLFWYTVEYWVVKIPYYGADTVSVEIPPDSKVIMSMPSPYDQTESQMYFMPRENDIIIQYIKR